MASPEEQKTGRLVALSIASVVVIVVLSIVTYYWHEDLVIADMVKGGADPLRAKCAINHDPNVCPVLYGR